MKVIESNLTVFEGVDLLYAGLLFFISYLYHKQGVKQAKKLKDNAEFFFTVTVSKAISLDKFTNLIEIKRYLLVRISRIFLKVSLMFRYIRLLLWYKALFRKDHLRIG